MNPISPQPISRQDFLKTCGATCLALTGLTLAGCKSVYYAQEPVIKDKSIQVKKTEFVAVSKKGEKSIRPFILVELKGQAFPIYLYRRSDTDFNAVLMKCSHQGNELNAHDGYLTCPAHGSEYDATGKVTEGPAERNLTAYRVTTEGEFIYIHIA